MLDEMTRRNDSKFASSMSFSLLFLCMWEFIKEKWRRKTRFEELCQVISSSINLISEE